MFSIGFSLGSDLDDTHEHRIPADIKDELIAAMLLLLIAYSKIRRLVSIDVQATDATPSAGGAVAGRVSVELVEALYQSLSSKAGTHV